MSDVVQLHPEPEIGVWFCVCDSYSFKLRSDGVAICLLCGREHDSLEFASWCVDPEPELQPVPQSAHVVRECGTVELALKRVLGRVDANKTMGVVVVQEDGDVHTWGNTPETADQRRWLVRRLREAYRLLSATR